MFLLRRVAGRVAALWLCLVLAAAPSAFSAAAERLVTDMAGRAVKVPDKIARVATIGPVPVLTSFVFALGEAATIVNNLPRNLGGPRWRFQYVVAPHMATQPIIQSGEGPSIEGVAQLAPDVVLTMDRPTIDLVERTRTPAIYLAWREPDDVKAAMRLLGTLYEKPDAAEAYCRYFDEALARVNSRTGVLPDNQRPRVLYANLKRLTQPHRIAEWWIAKAGGRSVTDDGRTNEAFNFSIEQVLQWDPEVIIVSAAHEVADAYADARLASVSAIKNRRVYAVPMGAHVWGNRTAEQPLTILWAAKALHPELFKDVAIANEVRSFYANFFKSELSDDDVDVMLEGRAGER
jgi:iron complex transport system substrate-binding protein